MSNLQRPNMAEGLEEEELNLNMLEMEPKNNRPTKQQAEELAAANAALGFTPNTKPPPIPGSEKKNSKAGQGGSQRRTKPKPVSPEADSIRPRQAPVLRSKTEKKAPRAPTTELCSHRARLDTKKLVADFADEMDLYQKGVYELAIYSTIKLYGSDDLKERSDKLFPDIALYLTKLESEKK